ncbi:type II toxin-antitoxin system RelE/ParE family toxin [Persicimonas caeni]|uniref:Type II toxin-antitoxin system RelE/ParE family toxin n=1 Tax=Persicimonas caeni TaxID=2292766 RepID=A0A4Y6Q325_PERCE|nr:type II toxin-antitoxin system RelE/ParE family toxin [Persicimonas caeni]QED36206.1 type II toxin-antitoxin system RelE/ParE family toxin [Persicimonas caeni]
MRHGFCSRDRRGSYRVIYRTTDDAVEVLAVLHGAQKLPPTPPTGDDE